METAKFRSCIVHVQLDARSPFRLLNGFIDHPNNVIEGVCLDEWIVLPLYNVTSIHSFETD